MPDPSEASRFDSGTPLVPVHVAHPSGDVNQILAPVDMAVEDLHANLGDAGYHHDLSDIEKIAPQKQPTAAGALENSADFRAQSAAAWNAVSKGASPNAESGFSVYDDGGASSLHTEIHPQGSGMASRWSDKISYGPSDFAIQHTHPSISSDKPSQNDIEASKRIKKPIYVTSRTGLWMVRPSDGKVIQVFKSPTWMTEKDPK